MKLAYDASGIQVYEGDALTVLRSLPAESVQTCITSPPYWGLRDYGLPPIVIGGKPTCAHEWLTERIEREMRRGLGLAKSKVSTRGGGKKIAKVGWQRFERGQCLRCGAWKGCLGLEASPALYVQHIVEIFRQVRRVLRRDGTLWLNLGDCYCSAPPGEEQLDQGASTLSGGPRRGHRSSFRRDRIPRQDHPHKRAFNLKPKDLIGIPWRVAFALQDDGWYLRSDVIWHKANPMPESVKDRPTRAHEYVFLLAKSGRYYYDQDAIKEPASENTHSRTAQATKTPAGWNKGKGHHHTVQGRYPGVNPKAAQIELTSSRKCQPKQNPSWSAAMVNVVGYRNKRTVWTLSTEPFLEAHFATFPTKLIEPCILAGSPPGALVLDPFHGAGTTMVVARTLGRRYIGSELKGEYIPMSLNRLDPQEVLAL